MTQAIHIRLADDLRDAVVRLAEIEDRRPSDMLRRLIKEAIQTREERSRKGLRDDE